MRFDALSHHARIGRLKMRTTINLPTAILADVHTLAAFNRRTVSSEIEIAVTRWLLLNSEIVRREKTKGKNHDRK